jgi:hypothetical protein
MYLRHKTCVWIRPTSNKITYKLRFVVSAISYTQTTAQYLPILMTQPLRTAGLYCMRSFAIFLSTCVNLSGTRSFTGYVLSIVLLLAYRLTYHCYIDWPTTAISIDLPLLYRLTYHCYIEWTTTAISIDLPPLYRLTYHRYIDWTTTAISIDLPLLYRLTYHWYIDWPTTAISIDLPPLYRLTYPRTRWPPPPSQPAAQSEFLAWKVSKF